MANDELTGSERLVLLVLMAEARETSNTRLAELGPELKKLSRDKLNRLRLIDSDLGQRPYVHSLTDKGWAQCAQELKSGPPARSTPQARGMYTVLSGLQRYLDREDLRPSDVFRFDPPVPDVAPDDVTPVATKSIEQRIRTAYSKLARGSGAWITIRDIRSELADVPKPKLDRELGEMYRFDDVTLVAQENQKELTDSVRSASITIGGKPVHLIAIEG